MPTPDNIDSLFDDILNPDVVVELDEYTTEDNKFLYRNLCLVSTVRTCIAHGLYNPYLQIKDGNDTLLFNDRLLITDNDHSPKYASDILDCSIDFLIDKNDLDTLGYVISGYRENKPQIGSFPSTTPTTSYTESNYSYVAGVILKKHNIKPLDPKNYIINFAIHHFDMRYKTWRIEVSSL